MKKTLPILSITVLIAGLLMTFMSCQSKKSPDSLTLSSVDTTGLAQFQSWKAMNEEKNANMSYVQGYKDAMATKTVTKTKVVHRPAPVAQTAKKKGWSKGAKGTVIGTASGALAGALIDKKNRVAGGIIGGLLGGGIGYLVGHNMDKKDGRFN